MKVVKNDLYDYGLKIFQDENLFKFSLDSILLSEFVEIKSNMRCIVDFCSGNCAIPLILSTKTKSKIIGFEIQKKVYQLAYNSILVNKLEKQVQVVNANLNESLEYILPETIDCITCNPPFFKVSNDSILNDDPQKAIARHEITTSLEDIIVTSRYLLKNKAPLYLVHRPERLAEIMEILKKYKFAVKRLQFIYSSYQKNAIMVLIKATKNGQEGLIVNKPINVLDYKSYKGIFS